MGMLEYIRAVKRGLRDSYGFVPVRGDEHDPVFADGAVPDGNYPMTIDGKRDHVRIVNGHIDCCNFVE